MIIVTAVLDACVLYPAFMRDFLLRLADDNLYAPRWSADIQDEWIRNKLKDQPSMTPEALAYTRTTMEAAFPQALTTGYEPLIETITLPDENDRHVVAAAIQSRATIIVTSNLDDFPAAKLAPYGIMATHPDKFAVTLYKATPTDMLAIIRRHRAGLKRPALTAVEYIAKLRRNQLLQMATILDQHQGEI